MDQNSKEKLFFFGQPGCLKVKFDIPIRPSDSPNDMEENSNSEVNSKNSLNDDENNTMRKAENTSDDDGAELLKKIDEALGDKNTQNPEIIGSSGKSNDKSISENAMNDIKEEQIMEEKKSESALEIASPANKETISEINVKSVNSLDDHKNISKLDECIEEGSSDLIQNQELEKSVEIVNKSEETESKERSNEAIETEEPPTIIESMDNISESKEIKNEEHESANEISMCSQSSLEESAPIKEEISLLEVEPHANDTDKINKNIECTNNDNDQLKNVDNITEEISHSETQTSSKSYTQDAQIEASPIDNEVLQPVIAEISNNYETHLESKVNESVNKEMSEKQENLENDDSESKPIEFMNEMAPEKSESLIIDSESKADEKVAENLQIVGSDSRLVEPMDEVIPEKSEILENIDSKIKPDESIDVVVPENPESLQASNLETKVGEIMNEVIPGKSEILQTIVSESKADEVVPENLHTVSSESKKDEFMNEVIQEKPGSSENVASESKSDEIIPENLKMTSSDSRVDESMEEMTPEKSEILENVGSELKPDESMEAVVPEKPGSLQTSNLKSNVNESMDEVMPEKSEILKTIGSESKANEIVPENLQTVSSESSVDESMDEVIPEKSENLQTVDPKTKISTENKLNEKLPCIQEGIPHTAVDTKDQKIDEQEISVKLNAEQVQADEKCVSHDIIVETQKEIEEPTIESNEQITKSVIDQEQKSPIVGTEKLEVESVSKFDESLSHESKETDSSESSDLKEPINEIENSQDKVIFEEQQKISIEVENQELLTEESGNISNENEGENIIESRIQELSVVPDESIKNKSDENLVIEAPHSEDVSSMKEETHTVLSGQELIKSEVKVEGSLSEETQNSESVTIIDNKIVDSKEEIVATSQPVCGTSENELEILEEKSVSSVQDLEIETPDTSQEPQDLSVKTVIEDCNEQEVSQKTSDCDKNEKGSAEISTVDQNMEENIPSSDSGEKPLKTECQEDLDKQQNEEIGLDVEELSQDGSKEKLKVMVAENQLPESIDIEQEKVENSESMDTESNKQYSELMDTEREIIQSGKSMDAEHDIDAVSIDSTDEKISNIEINQESHEQECKMESMSPKEGGNGSMEEQTTESIEEKVGNLEQIENQTVELISTTTEIKDEFKQEEILSEPQNESIKNDNMVKEFQVTCQDKGIEKDQSITEDDKLNLEQKTEDSSEESHENVQLQSEENETSYEQEISIKSPVVSDESKENDKVQPSKSIEMACDPLEHDVNESIQESTTKDCTITNETDKQEIPKQNSEALHEYNQNKASAETELTNVLLEKSDKSSSSENIQSDLENASQSDEEILLQKESDENQEQTTSYAENTENSNNITSDNIIEGKPHSEEKSVEMEAQNEMIASDSVSVMKDNGTCEKVEENLAHENQIETPEKIELTENVSENMTSETEEIVMDKKVECTSNLITEVESKVIPEVKESQKIIEKADSYRETKNNDEIPINIETSVVENAETIPQKAITVEQNSNEKINDNQVELSKNDNKSSIIEKVSPVENINIQIESIGNLNKSSTLDIVQEKGLEEDSSNLSINDKIKSVSDEIIVKKSEILDTDECKVNLYTEKQYELVSEQPTENVPSKSDIKDFKEEINIDKSQEVAVQNLTDKMISNKVVESDNSDVKSEVAENLKHADDIKSNLEIGSSIDADTKSADTNNEPQLKEIDLSSKEKSDDKPAQQNTIVETVMMPDESSDQECSVKTQEEHEHEKSEIQISGDAEQAPVDPFEEVEAQKSNSFDQLLDKKPQHESIPITKAFSKPAATRKRKMSERKSISESDSDGGSHFVTDSVSNEKSSDEETVATKKPRIRNKITATRNTRATRQSARVSEETKTAVANKEQKIDQPKDKSDDSKEKKDEEKTLQSLKFDYDENEDVAANMAAIKNLICKDTSKKESGDDSNDSSADESDQKKPVRKGRKGKRSRATKKNDAQESSSDESKSAKVPDSKRSKTSESEETTVEKQSKKKRDSSGKGILKHIDTSLVIETVETEAPIRQSRRIAQQKIREETERRQMEEKMLKQMKEEAERKKKLALIPEPPEDDDSSDESYKEDSRKKKKKKLKPSDKPWQTSSSHSEHSESEDEFERPQSEDPGSPLFRSDHEFSPESDVDDTAPVQPMKRARTAKKQELSSDDEDVNPNHACQVCHKTDCPEWILLCDECDHGYHCSCLKPIIFCIPSGNWYCPLCCHKKLIDNLSVQLEKLDTLIYNIKAEEIRQQKQLEIKKLTEISEENIIRDRRKNKPEHSKDEHSRDSKSRKIESDQENESDDDSSDNSSDNEPLNEVFYKLRRRNQTTTSYRFNDYDDLINSAIRDEMEEVKGMGNAGRGKDISTIIEADKEEKKQQKLEKDKEKVAEESTEKPSEQKEGEESSGSEIIRPKKSMQRKKKNRKLNNLDETSEEDKASDEDFKGSGSTNSDSEEEYTMSSVSESSLDLPLKKKSKTGPRSTRSAARNRRYQETFINDNSSDDEPLIKKRNKKQIDSDEEEFDANEDENSDGSTAEDIDSEDLCDDTETDDSSENNWPRKKKKKIASYDVKKPRKPAKKNDEGNDKAFRAGISKKKILTKQSDNESEGSENDSVKGRRKTRGKKLLYLIEDDYESDDGIKPGIGVVRPETPPEERELFVKKQEEIKRMLAEKNTEAAKQLAVPTIEPLKFSIEKPKSPSPPPLTSSEAASFSVVPKNVIEGAKALDMDYNKIKPAHFGIHSKSSDHPSAHDMSEEDLARMMEEEDFAQHQLKLVGESIGRNKLLELEVKEEAFAVFSKGAKPKDEKDLIETHPPTDTKKRARKPKPEKHISEFLPLKPLQTEPSPQATPSPQHIIQPNVPIKAQLNEPIKPSTSQMSNIPSVPPLISNPVSHPPYPNLQLRYPGPRSHPLNVQDRPSVLSNYLPRHEGMPPRLEGMPPRLEGMPPRLEGIPQHMRFPQPLPESFLHKSQPIIPHLQAQPPPSEEVEEKKKGRRKKYTPLRSDLPESNVPKVAKLDTAAPSSVIHSTLNLSTERPDDKSKVNLPPLQRAKTASIPEVFNPANNPGSVITRLLQPQQRLPFGGFAEQINVSPSNPSNPSSNSRAFPEDMKHHPVAKQIRPGPPAQFSENPFAPRSIHTLYRGPPTSQSSIYGIPSHHARIPYPFHLHPNSNLRPNIQEYGAPYNIPPQFGYYAPPAHSRQHPTNPAAPTVNHPEHPEIPPNSARPNNNNSNPNEEPSESSEFGGLVSYFSSQQELD